MLTGVTSFGWAIHRLIHKSFVTGGTAGTLFVVCRSAGASLQMTGGHNLVRLYALVICDHCPPPSAQGNVEEFCVCSSP